MRRAFIKFIILTIMSLLSLNMAACGKNDKEAENSASTEAGAVGDIMAVELIDKDGNKYVVEGIGVTDENGKTTITVKDKQGNTTVVVGDVSKDDNGHKVVVNGSVVSGDKLVTDDGKEINAGGSSVGNVESNDYGVIVPDITTEEGDRKSEVSVEEETTAAAETQAQSGTNSEETSKSWVTIIPAPTEAATQAEKETQKAAEKETVKTGQAEKETQKATVSSEPETVMYVDVTYYDWEGVLRTGIVQSMQPLYTKTPSDYFSKLGLDYLDKRVLLSLAGNSVRYPKKSDYGDVILPNKDYSVYFTAEGVKNSTAKFTLVKKGGPTVVAGQLVDGSYYYNYVVDDSIYGKCTWPAEIPMHQMLWWGDKLGYFCTSANAMPAAKTTDFFLDGSWIEIGDNQTWADGNAYYFRFITPNDRTLNNFYRVDGNDDTITKSH